MKTNKEKMRKITKENEVQNYNNLISGIHLVEKSGGKSGHYKAEK